MTNKIVLTLVYEQGSIYKIGHSIIEHKDDAFETIMAQAFEWKVPFKDITVYVSYKQLKITMSEKDINETTYES